MPGDGQFRVWVENARAVPIEKELARRGVDLQRQSKFEFVGPCPRCTTGVDRFSINIEKQVWNCRRCGRGGDVIELVRFLDEVDFITLA